MNTPVTQEIIGRFYESLDAVIANKTIRGVQTYCRLYGIDRRNLLANKKDLSRGWFQVSWLVPLIEVYGVSARWLMTGRGNMFSRS